MTPRTLAAAALAAAAVLLTAPSALADDAPVPDKTVTCYAVDEQGNPLCPAADPVPAADPAPLLTNPVAYPDPAETQTCGARTYLKLAGIEGVIWRDGDGPTEVPPGTGFTLAARPADGYVFGADAILTQDADGWFLVPVVQLPACAAPTGDLSTAPEPPAATAPAAPAPVDTATPAAQEEAPAAAAPTLANTGPQAVGVTAAIGALLVLLGIVVALWGRQRA